MSFFSCFLQEHPGAEPEFGEVLFFQRFLHPPGGLLVVGTAGVQGRFLGIVEVVFRAVFHHPLDRVGAGAARGQQGGVRKDVVPLQVILHQGDGPVVVRGGSFIRGFISLFPAAGRQAEKGYPPKGATFSCKWGDGFAANIRGFSSRKGFWGTSFVGFKGRREFVLRGRLRKFIFGEMPR